MKSDRDLAVTRVGKTGGDLAARGAALWPLGYKKPVEAAYAKLVNEWRTRLFHLGKGGWLPIDISREKSSALKNLAYMRNCPPFGAITSVNVYRCTRVRVCPHCYAKAVPYAAYRAMEFARRILTHDKDQDYRPAFKVFYLRHTKEVSANLRPAREWIKSVMAVQYKELEVLRAGGTVYGAFVDMALSPVVGKLHTYNFRRGTMAIVKDTHPVLEFPYAVAQRTSNLMRLGPIASNIGWCFPYPVGMLRGSPAAAAGILNAAAEVRAKFTKSLGVLCSGNMRDFIRDGRTALAGDAGVPSAEPDDF